MLPVGEKIEKIMTLGNDWDDKDHGASVGATTGRQHSDHPMEEETLPNSIDKATAPDLINLTND